MLYATLFCGLAVLWLYFRYRRMTLLKRSNIPGPPAHFLFGNLAEFEEKGMKRCFQEWTDKYGPVVGFYMGGNPTVLATDLELLRNIQNIDFAQFSTRYQVIKGGIHPTNLGQKSVLWQGGPDWKRLRVAMGQMFTPSRLRMFVNGIKANVDSACRIFEKQSNGLKDEFDIVTSYRKMTFHSMVESQLSIKMDLEQCGDIEDALDKASAPRLKGILPTLMILFPEFTFLLFPLRKMWEEILEYFVKNPEGILYNLARQTLNMRKKTTVKSNDMLQLMMETRNLGRKENTADEASDKDGNGSGSYTDDEIVMNIFIFLLGGYETTASIFAYMTHNLVNNQDIQERMRQEVKQLVEQDGVLDYNTVNGLPLLEAFVKESCRMYPPLGPFVTRLSNTDYQYKDITIPAGVGVYVGVHQLQYDARYWPEPTVFDPERFMGKQQLEPLAYQPFGAGPRNCVGMRFAVLQLKLVMAELLLRYNFTAGPSSETGLLETYEKFSVMAPKNGVWVKLVSIK
ncbi:Thromboxane-A synthase [Halotydeus destructor]|nr:Thromboxane-A synthase [Halotydeus destructor]